MGCRICCHEARPGLQTCVLCGQREAARVKARREQLKAFGLCTKGCGMPSEPGRGGKCEFHAERDVQSCRDRRERARAAQV